MFSVVDSACAGSAVVAFYSRNCLYHTCSCRHSQQQPPHPGAAQRSSAHSGLPFLVQEVPASSALLRCGAGCHLKVHPLFFSALIGSQLSNACKPATESGSGGCASATRVSCRGGHGSEEPSSSQRQRCEGQAGGGTQLFIPRQHGGLCRWSWEAACLLTIDCLHSTARWQSRAVSWVAPTHWAAPELQADRAFIPRSRAGPRCAVQPCRGAERPQALSCCLTHGQTGLKHDKEQICAFFPLVLRPNCLAAILVR